MAERNLLIICNSFPNEENSFIGGNFVKQQIKYLSKHFDHVFVISPVAFGMDLVRKASFSDYHYDNVQVFFPKYINFPFFYHHSRFIWRYLETRAVVSVIQNQEISFDIIHAHFTWPSGSVAVRLKETYKVPVIITEGSSTTLYRELGSLNWYYTETYQLSDIIIRNNIKDIPLFVKAGVDREKIFHVQYGYDKKTYFPLPKEEARRKLEIGPGKKVILTIGRLYVEKGHSFLIDAMRTIIQHYPEAVCYIGGTGPLREKLQQEIDKHHLENSVKLVGFVPSDFMTTWINAADLFVLPSLTEGNPTVMFECLGCGVPFIGTTVGGIPEVINSDDFGLLVEPANSEDLAAKIILGLTKDWSRERILEYAEQYSLEKTASVIIGLYQRICTSMKDRSRGKQDI